MGNSKIVVYGETLIDITDITVTANKVLKGTTFVDSDAEKHEGTCTYDADTSDATTKVAEALEGTVFYGNGARKVGEMTNNSGFSAEITTRDQQITVPWGFHDGASKIGISATERSKIKPENIAEGVVILGQTGTHKSGTQEVKEAITVTPTTSQQIITPSEGYTCISQVTVKAVPIVRTANPGGKSYTVTVG